jgi:hypothetical protein
VVVGLLDGAAAVAFGELGDDFGGDEVGAEERGSWVGRHCGGRMGMCGEVGEASRRSNGAIECLGDVEGCWVAYR